MKFKTLTFDTLDSTSTYIKQNINLFTENFSSVRAVDQIAGRGRYGRGWSSSGGLDLSFSTVFFPEKNISGISCVTIYAGLAIFRSLKKIIHDGLHIKWPNDIFYHEKKICGILTELVIINDTPHVILGIGININSTNFPEEIKKSASSIKLITGINHDVEKIMQDVLSELSSILSSFRVPMDENIVSEWISSSKSIGSNVYYMYDEKEKPGMITGINRDGSILIKDAISLKELIYRGEVVFDK